uniref:Transmembrane channel-like protein 6-like n=1 Tax=Saccoglossus kowalevskii TaxID=10224 RepID=A0ABM0M6L4_SACKO|nr:PREDICTED: transmembrane channel-like protein 6-like [Saccoglossus kowalevskii]
MAAYINVAFVIPVTSFFVAQPYKESSDITACLPANDFLMSEAYKASYVLGSGNFNFYVTKIFCSWDYNITAKKSAALKQKSIYLELAERLSSQHDKKVYTKCEIFGIWMGRLGTNLLVLALIAGAGAAVVVGYEEKIGEQEQFGDLTVLIMPLIICGLNFVLPPIFSFISNYENYRSPRVKLYITMARTILLNAVLFIVLIHFWLERSGCKTVDMYTPSSGAANETSITNISTTPSMYVNTTKNPVVCIENCWETEFGQELYRLVIIDFIFLLISTFFVEFMMRIFSDYCCKTRSRPEFDIARNTMELIQSQTLTWLGLFYSPLLVFICIIKLIVLFYVKRYSVIGNCTPSLKPWRAGRTTTVFLGMLLCMFFLAAGTVCYSMVR